MNMDDRVVYLTMSYDIVDGVLPKGWSDVKTIWLDANNCGSSDVDPPQEKGTFTITSIPWTPNFDGEILSLGGHLHGKLIVIFHLQPNGFTDRSKMEAMFSRLSPRIQAPYAQARPGTARMRNIFSKTRRALR